MPNCSQPLGGDQNDYFLSQDSCHIYVILLNCGEAKHVLVIMSVCIDQFSIELVFFNQTLVSLVLMKLTLNVFLLGFFISAIFQLLQLLANIFLHF